MKKEEKKMYSAPQLTVVTVKSERGYAASGLGLYDLFTLTANADSMEKWESNTSYQYNDWS